MAKKKQTPINDPAPTETLPEAPAFLDEIARQEWYRLGNLLLKAGLLTPADYTAFAMFCVNWSRFVRNEILVQQKGETYETPNSEYPIHATELNISNAAQKQMTTMLKHFGLSPSARAAMKIEKSDKGAELVKYLTGEKE